MFEFLDSLPRLGLIGGIISFVFGIIVLIFPKILNYLVGIWLILIGVVALIAFFRQSEASKIYRRVVKGQKPDFHGLDEREAVTGWGGLALTQRVCVLKTGHFDKVVLSGDVLLFPHIDGDALGAQVI